MIATLLRHARQRRLAWAVGASLVLLLTWTGMAFVQTGSPANATTSTERESVPASPPEEAVSSKSGSGAKVTVLSVRGGPIPSQQAEPEPLPAPRPVLGFRAIEPPAGQRVSPLREQVPLPPPPAFLASLRMEEMPPALPPTAPPAPAAPETKPTESGVVQAGCTSCGNGAGLLPAVPPPMLSGLEGGGDPGCACSGSCCVPGRKACYPCEADTCVGRFLCGLYECICCPDPCYDPQWLPIADAAFFVESVRPQTQQRLRWDAGFNVQFPDRSEYFWARADGMGKGPNPLLAGTPTSSIPGVSGLPGAPTPTGGTSGTAKVPTGGPLPVPTPTGGTTHGGGGRGRRTPFKGEIGLRYDDLSLYTEGATGAVGVFMEMPYRSLDPDLAAHAANMGDMNFGTKTLLFDCELLQLGFIFRTYVPVGNFTKGIGNGHVSLEPSLLATVKLYPDTYLQAQISEWIPLGGDPNYEGSIFHYHTSLNQVLYRILPNVPVIGTLEFNGWSFQAGQYTDPILGPFQKSSDEAYLSVGSGLRLFVCDRIDFGIAAAWSVSRHHWADQLYRSEFRWRF
jgi:hypothetical protein